MKTEETGKQGNTGTQEKTEKIEEEQGKPRENRGSSGKWRNTG